MTRNRLRIIHSDHVLALPEAMGEMAGSLYDMFTDMMATNRPMMEMGVTFGKALLNFL